MALTDADVDALPTGPLSSPHTLLMLAILTTSENEPLNTNHVRLMTRGLFKPDYDRVTNPT